MIKLHYTALILLSIFIYANCTASQSEQSFWVSLGIGSTLKAFDENHSGISAGVIGNYQYSRNLLSLQMIYNSEMRSLAYNPRPNLSISHISLIYSRLLQGKDYLLSAGIGPGYNTFIERGGLVKDNWPSASEYEKLVSHHIGMIMVAQAFLHGSLFGFGIDYFININKKKTMSGFLICLRFGKF